MARYSLSWRYDSHRNLYTKQIDKSELDRGSLSVTPPSEAWEPPRDMEFYLAIKMLPQGRSSMVTSPKNVKLFKLSGGGEYDEHQLNDTRVLFPTAYWGAFGGHQLSRLYDTPMHFPTTYWDTFDSYQLSPEGAFLVGTDERWKSLITSQELDAIREVFERHLRGFTEGAALRERFSQRRRDRVLELIMSDLREYYDRARFSVKPPETVQPSP